MQNLAPFDLVYDNWVGGKPVPNLIQSDDMLTDFSHHAFQWPFVAGFKLEPLCQDHQYPVRHYRLTDHYPSPSFYPVNLAKFDVNIDYFGLMTVEVRQHLKIGRLLVLFFSPDHVNVLESRRALEMYARQHDLPENCYRVVVNNHMVINQVRWFYSWVDTELTFWHDNHGQTPLPVHDRPRSRDFTVLARQHQPWRALAMAHFRKAGLLDSAYWSYGNFQPAQAMSYNPVRLDQISNLTQQDLDNFLHTAPHRADDLPLGVQGDHGYVVPQHFSDSYIHVVMESSIEAQGGTVITEKTFKPIKHGQPFVILGTRHSLLALQNLGYRIFLGVIPTDYDKESNHKERYLKVYRTLLDIKNTGARTVFEQCQADVEHNQRLFVTHKRRRLRFLQGMLVFHFYYTNNDYGEYGYYKDIFQTL